MKVIRALYKDGAGIVRRGYKRHLDDNGYPSCRDIVRDSVGMGGANGWILCYVTDDGESTLDVEVE